MGELDKKKLLDLVNRRHLEAYIQWFRLKQLREKTLRAKLWHIYLFLHYTDFNDANDCAQEQLEDSSLSSKTSMPLHHPRRHARTKFFFRWRVPDKENELLQNIRVKKPRRYLPVDPLITCDDINRLIEACDKPRNRGG